MFFVCLHVDKRTQPSVKFSFFVTVREISGISLLGRNAILCTCLVSGSNR